ncbi:aminoacyl-histidine dipeptidase [Clostridium polynesiense]|uniref:aminoacyl-histidine dipeptidase n=1 Tax=Clostridium polynesiense TaxID=1325933 RepID=UPI00058BAA6F|nr:aminoacyl-histidine dipeptidase [Clostridium polynesiense]
MAVLKDLQPGKVFHFFEEMSNIPRTSGNEKMISDWLVRFAKDRNLEVHQDEALNVIIKKPGTSGYEKSSAVIIQGHMDMVGEKATESNHNFLNDPLKLRVIDDYVYATDTTLGGDDGIAVAYGLALLDSSDIPHPPIELLVTTNEETGMDGAANLDASSLTGKTLINIDAEEEGIFLVSCAGGITSTVSFQPDYEKYQGEAFKISITGLKGGHSGIEIIKQRANSVKLLGRLLYKLSEECDLRLVSLSGGSKHNAISREAEAHIAILSEDYTKLNETVNIMADAFRNEYSVEDPDIKIQVASSKADKIMTKKSTENIISYMVTVPDGVQTMSKEIEGLVVSSLNLGVLEELNGKVQFTHAIRSSVKSLKFEIMVRIRAIADLCSGTVQMFSDYPEWQYESDSKVRKAAVETYSKLYGKEPEIQAIHAGLECGLLKEKLPEADMISFGPNLYNVHTPSEHMSISSVARTWDFLVALLKNLK